MASGLVALLDDVAAITKLAAASLDDVAGAAGRSGSKAAGVVIDDTAVTPRYVVGFTPDRELPIIGKIALGSIRNKLLFLLPGALLLSALAPWAITPILMAGGAFLCFEAAEKILEIVHVDETNVHNEPVLAEPAQREDEMVSGAIRTDLILSAEIMAISLSEIAGDPLLTQAIVLALISLVITAGVYGVVAVIVKMDDIGLHLAKTGGGLSQLGRGLVRAMPLLLSALATIGTAAMAWVGGGIIVHGLAALGMPRVEHAIEYIAEGAAHALPAALEGVAAWIVFAVGAGLFGIALGAVLAALWHKLKH